MKKITLFTSLSFIINLSFSQSIDTAKTVKKNWTKGGGFNIDFAQSSFTNWAAGGQNAISISSLLNTFANYKKGNNTWDNALILGYGMLQSGTTALRKNEDKIDLSSKYGRYAFYDHWYYSAILNFKSQFADGYNYPNDSIVVSHFLAPGYVLASIGMDYKSTDNSFSLFISPITSRTIIVNDQRLADLGAYGVTAATNETINGVSVTTKRGELINPQFGGYLKMTFKKDIMTNVNLSSKLELFSNYLKNPENVVVNWENIIMFKVNKYISSSISTVMIYDHTIPVPVERAVNGVKVAGVGPRLQFKEVLALGFSYKF
jgi:Protein of unknown function (DUF3078)